MNVRELRARVWAVRGRVVRAGLTGLAMLGVAAFAVGCEMEPPDVPEPVYTSFGDLPKLEFDLGRIEVVETPSAPHPDDVAHLLPTPPAVAAKLWVEDRLRASGSVGVLRVTIEEASARATPLPTNTDIEGLFTEEQNERLDVALRVTIAAVDENGAVQGHATTEATRSRTLPEGVTLGEREQLYDDVIGGLLYDFNEGQEDAIRHYLHIYLR